MIEKGAGQKSSHSSIRSVFCHNALPAARTAQQEMFSLMVGFWQMLFRRAEFQVLILGIDAAGKTTVLEQIKSRFLGREPLPATKIAPTVGLNIGRIQMRRAKLIFWDLGGQATLRTIWEKYYSEAHGLVYVVDAADAQRLDESRTTLHQLLSHTDLCGIPLLVLANKQDAPNALSPQEIEAHFGLQQLLESTQPRKVFGSAALTGDGIQESVNWLVEALSESPRAQGIQAY
jgi:ADP-ribosylation factor related protein 1